MFRDCVFIGGVIAVVLRVVIGFGIRVFIFIQAFQFVAHLLFI